MPRLQTLEIRALSIEDYDSMMKLWKRAGLQFRPRGRDSREMIKQQMRGSPDLFIGAFHQGKLVGIVIGSYDGRMKGWINRLAVDPEHRRKRIAQQLVDAAEKALEKHGATIFCALIETPNEESLGLFQKLRYQVHREISYASKRKSEDV